jgi:hypothetical protein
VPISYARGSGTHSVGRAHRGGVVVGTSLGSSGVPWGRTSAAWAPRCSAGARSGRACRPARSTWRRARTTCGAGAARGGPARSVWARAHGECGAHPGAWVRAHRRWQREAPAWGASRGACGASRYAVGSGAGGVGRAGGCRGPARGCRGGVRPRRADYRRRPCGDTRIGCVRAAAGVRRKREHVAITAPAVGGSTRECIVVLARANCVMPERHSEERAAFSSTSAAM